VADYFGELLGKNMLTWKRSWNEFKVKKDTIKAGSADYVGQISKTKRFKLNRVIAVVKDDAGDEYVITKE
jgi:hypothetical protein